MSDDVVDRLDALEREISGLKDQVRHLERGADHLERELNTAKNDINDLERGLERARQ